MMLLAILPVASQTYM